MSCPACQPYFDFPGVLTCGAPPTPERVALQSRLTEVWETLAAWHENPESGLYVEGLRLRCRTCGQGAEADDDAWYGGRFDRLPGA